MAEESDLDRTEAPSPRRLEQAREEGQIVRSRELSTFAVLAATGVGLGILGPGMTERFAQLVQAGLRLTRAQAFDEALAMHRAGELALEASLVLAPLGAVMLIAALAAPLLLGGWNFSVKAFQPDWQRLDPLRGLGRLFSVSGLSELVKAIGKSLVVAVASFWALWHFADALFPLAAMSPQSGVSELGRVVWLSFLTVVAAMALIAAADVPVQLWTYYRQLRMTREELRNENKEMEGDPHLKARIRSQQREIARRRMMAEVPKADVVVTNPLHFAVALKYREGSMRAPVVLAKGVHLLAARIRDLAREHGVPVLESPPLARALYKHVDIGGEIPEKLYAAVAQVLAYVYQLKRSAETGTARPEAPAVIPVPPGMDPAEPAEGTR